MSLARIVPLFWLQSLLGCLERIVAEEPMNKCLSRLLFAVAFASLVASQPAIAQPSPNQDGYAYYYEKLGDGEWEKVGVKLQYLGRKTYA